jgi:hypothetical protein
MTERNPIHASSGSADVEQEMTNLSDSKGASSENTHNAQGNTEQAEDMWKARISNVQGIKLSHRVHSYRWIFLYLVFLFTFLANLIYYIFFHVQYSLVLSTELNQCYSFSEIYSFPPINQTVVYAPFIHNIGSQQVIDPQMFLTAQFQVMPPDNGVFLNPSNNFFMFPSENSSAYYFTPSGFFANDNDNENTVRFAEVILMSNFTSSISSYHTTNGAPNNSQISLMRWVTTNITRSTPMRIVLPITRLRIIPDEVNLKLLVCCKRLPMDRSLPIVK